MGVGVLDFLPPVWDFSILMIFSRSFNMFFRTNIYIIDILLYIIIEFLLLLWLSLLLLLLYVFYLLLWFIIIIYYIIYYILFIIIIYYNYYLLLLLLLLWSWLFVIVINNYYYIIIINNNNHYSYYIHTNTKPQLEPFPEASKRCMKTKFPQLSGDSPRTRRFVCGQRGWPVVIPQVIGAYIFLLMF